MGEGVAVGVAVIVYIGKLCTPGFIFSIKAGIFALEAGMLEWLCSPVHI